MFDDGVDYERIRKRVEQREARRSEFFIHFTVFTVINALSWVAWFALSRSLNISALDFPWPLIVSLGWGAGLVGHAIEVYRQGERFSAARDAATWRRMEQIYGPDWQDSATDAEFEQIQKQVEHYYEKRGEFYIHLGVFVMINIMLWLIWLGTRQYFGLPWPLLATAGWGVGLFAHLADVQTHSDSRIARRERAILREIERETARGALEKPKRKPKRERLVLGDDGEVLEIAEDDDEWEEAARS